MASLVSIADLSVWTRQEVGYDDEWALAVLEAASEVVRLAAQQPGWTAQNAPARAKQIAAHLAARSYLNPDSIQSEGSIGPLGGDRYVQELATALHLTQAERDELARMSPVGASGRGGLWIQPVGTNTLEPTEVYLRDSTGSDWTIPYGHPDDFPAYG